MQGTDQFPTLLRPQNSGIARWIVLLLHGPADEPLSIRNRAWMDRPGMDASRSCAPATPGKQPSGDGAASRRRFGHVRAAGTRMARKHRRHGRTGSGLRVRSGSRFRKHRTRSVDAGSLRACHLFGHAHSPFRSNHHLWRTRGLGRASREGTRGWSGFGEKSDCPDRTVPPGFGGRRQAWRFLRRRRDHHQDAPPQPGRSGTGPIPPAILCLLKHGTFGTPARY